VRMLALVVTGDEPEGLLKPYCAERLAELGITGITVMRGPSTTGIFFEGWAFDPAASTRAVLAIIAQEATLLEALYPLIHIAVIAGDAPSSGFGGRNDLTPMDEGVHR
jgi:hypothetical protein